MHPTSTVEIMLDRSRTLRMTFRAMREIKEATGVDLLNTGSLEGLAAEQFPSVICAMLRHEDKDLTPEAVEEMIDLQNARYVMERLTLCLTGSVPEWPSSDEEGEEGETADPKAGPASQDG